MTTEQQNNLKSLIEELKCEDVQLHRHFYFRKDEYGKDCFCALGYMAKDDAAMLNYLRDRNSFIISSNLFDDIREELGKRYGLSKSDLHSIQRINDGDGFHLSSGKIGKAGVIEYLELVLSNTRGVTEV